MCQRNDLPLGCLSPEVGGRGGDVHAVVVAGWTDNVVHREPLPCAAAPAQRCSPAAHAHYRAGVPVTHCMFLSADLVLYGTPQMSYAELLWVDYLGMYIRSEVAGKEAEVVRVPFYRWAGKLWGRGCGGREGPWQGLGGTCHERGGIRIAAWGVCLH